MLLCFQVASGFKINLNISELVRIGGNNDAGSFAEVLGCKEVKLHFKYHGVLLGAKYKYQITWEPVIELCKKRLVGWKKNFLSKEGRYALIKSTLANLPIYYLSTITIHVKVAKKLEAIQCNSFGETMMVIENTIW